jgi:hypothetical protein
MPLKNTYNASSAPSHVLTFQPQSVSIRQCRPACSAAKDDAHNVMVGRQVHQLTMDSALLSGNRRRSSMVLNYTIEFVIWYRRSLD